MDRVDGSGAPAHAASRSPTVAPVPGSFDPIADAYAEAFPDGLSTEPDDLRWIDAVVDAAVPGLPVADLGCGPGQVGAVLSGRVGRVVQLDLSATMLSRARATNPGAWSIHGSSTELGLRTGALGAVVCYYSIVNLAPEVLVDAVGEVARVLAPGGPALFVFQCSGETTRYTEAFGVPVDLTWYRHDPDEVASIARAAGLAVVDRDVRPPDDRYESLAQCALLTRRV